MIEMSEGKYERMKRLSNEHGIINAAAMDQRGSLFKRLSQAKDIDVSDVTNEMMEEFKEAISQVLTPYASAILLDPEWGKPGMKARADGTGLVVSYEKSGQNRRYGDVYTHSLPAKMKELMPDWSVNRTVDLGGDAVKLLVYYHPEENELYQDQKKAMVERVGAECAHYEIPFFLEFVGFDAYGDSDWKTDPDLAEEKPTVVKESIAEFSRNKYNVDVLKVEIPVNMKFVEGTDSYIGENEAYDRDEALEHYQEAAEAADKPFIFLSAGVNAEEFRESLRLANEAGIDWNGVLCGRATWQDGISEYADGGQDALIEWLEDGGVENIQAMNEIIFEGACAWYDAYGGRDNINVI